MSKNTEQWAIITGASGGIGRAFAEIFAKQGVNLYITARDKKALDSCAKDWTATYKIKVEVFAGDLSDQSAVQALIQKVEACNTSVDYLVNNAGFGEYGEFTETDPVREQQMILLNIAALTSLTKHFGSVMKMQGHGRIVNVASIAAFLSGPYMAVYYATKAYVLHYSEAVHEELQGSGVGVTVLCPGPTQTGFATAAHAENASIFKGTLPTAEEVAQYGYASMMAGKHIAVHGLRNKVLISTIRFTPRRLLTRMVARTQR